MSSRLAICRRLTTSGAGCKAIWITVDCAVLGRRINEARNNFTIPEDIELPNLPSDLDVRALSITDDRLKFGELPVVWLC